jgi:hypothetical protein
MIARWIDLCARNRFLVFTGTLLLVPSLSCSMPSFVISASTAAPARFFSSAPMMLKAPQVSMQAMELRSAHRHRSQSAPPRKGSSRRRRMYPPPSADDRTGRFLIAQQARAGFGHMSRYARSPHSRPVTFPRFNGYRITRLGALPVLG